MLGNLFRGNQIERSNNWIFGTMLAFGILGFLASFVLSVEKVHLLENSDVVLSCSFNLLFNCGTVMQTWQASVFGFPNSFLGIMGFSIVITVAMAGLLNLRFTPWFMRLAQVGYTLGLIFAYWLFFQSVYVIEVLCPWCLVVTISTTLVFAALTRYNLRENVFGLSKNWDKRVQSWLKKDVDKLIAAGWLLLMVALVILKFGSDLFA
jgi:uncharacterized membrane protein